MRTAAGVESKHHALAVHVVNHFLDAVWEVGLVCVDESVTSYWNCARQHD